MNNELLEWIRDLAAELATGETALAPAIIEIMEDAYQDLQSLGQSYQAPAPDGAEEIREAMLEAVDLYLNSLDRIREVDASGQTEGLREALEWAEEASDLLEQVDYLVEQARVQDFQPDRA